jgi:hypothetical protein
MEKRNKGVLNFRLVINPDLSISKIAPEHVPPSLVPLLSPVLTIERCKSTIPYYTIYAKSKTLEDVL